MPTQSERILTNYYPDIIMYANSNNVAFMAS